MIFFRIFEYYFMNVREDTQCDGTILSDIIKINDPELLCTLFLEDIEEELSPLFKYKNNFKCLNCKWNKSTVTIEMENDESFTKITMDDFKNKSLFMEEFSLICKKVKEFVKKGLECIINFDVDFDQNSKFYDSFNQVIIEVIKESQPKFITLKIKEDDLFEYQDNPFENYVQYFYKKGDDFYIAFCRISGGTNLKEIADELQSLYSKFLMLFLKKSCKKLDLYKEQTTLEEKYIFIDELTGEEEGEVSSTRDESYSFLQNMLDDIFPYVCPNYFRHCFDLLKDEKKYSFFLTSYKNSLDTEEKKQNFEFICQNVCFCPRNVGCNCNKVKDAKVLLNHKIEDFDRSFLEELKSFLFYTLKNYPDDSSEVTSSIIFEIIFNEYNRKIECEIGNVFIMFRHIFYVNNLKKEELFNYYVKNSRQIPEEGLSTKQKDSIEIFYSKKKLN